MAQRERTFRLRFLREIGALHPVTYLLEFPVEDLSLKTKGKNFQGKEVIGKGRTNAEVELC